MINSHAPLLVQREEGNHAGNAIVRAIGKQVVQLPSQPIFWATLGAMTVSLLFRAPLGRSVRRTVSRVAVPLVFLGVYNRLKAANSE